jgi:hypothetical protein
MRSGRVRRIEAPQLCTLYVAIRSVGRAKVTAL